MTTGTHETLSFQTEVKQLLHLMIHSLYSNKEIFLRELISNASDALDKLRFESLADNSLYEQDADLKIEISLDKENNTITVKDNGIGMNREEAITNLGTIAKSGTKEFLQKITGDNSKDANLIGQFGVGFYSAFIVADELTVISRKAGHKPEEAIIWSSKGEGEYTIESTKRDKRGTEIILHLKEDAKEFLDPWRLRNIITTYSDHISFPVTMPKFPDYDKDGKEIPQEGAETVNRATALWQRNKAEITAEEYKEFYKYISHDYQEPMFWTHHRVEGKYEYTSLLFVPSAAPFDLWQRDRKYGVKLYVQRVFIMEDAEQFLPSYLRFVRGIIDCNDLPLNISREILQRNKTVDTIRNATTKRILGLLESHSEDKEQYSKFWNAFGEVLKEGPAEDPNNKEQIANLLRFASTYNDNDKQEVSFANYISRMKEGQEKIYYITAESYTAAKNSPHLEIFKEKGLEVLLLTDKVDEWLVAHLLEIKGKQLQSVTKGSVDLGKVTDEVFKEEQEKADEQYKDLVNRIKEVLKDKVKDVRMTARLTKSPACIVVDEHEMNMQMQRILKAAGQQIPISKPIFELNPKHAVVMRLDSEKDGNRFVNWTHLLFDQAILADGGQLEDPSAFANRLNQLFIDVQ